MGHLIKKQSPHRDIFSDGYESFLASSMMEEGHIVERQEWQKQGMDSYKKVHRWEKCTETRASACATQIKRSVTSGLPIVHVCISCSGTYVPLLDTLLSGKAGGRAPKSSLQYFCNFLWAHTYFELKVFNADYLMTLRRAKEQQLSEWTVTDTPTLSVGLRL